MISHKFKCVFVHVPKTAGQSVEQFFKEKLEVNEKYCEELLITKNDDPAKGPARFDVVNQNHTTQLSRFL